MLFSGRNTQQPPWTEPCKPLPSEQHTKISAEQPPRTQIGSNPARTLKPHHTLLPTNQAGTMAPSQRPRPATKQLFLEQTHLTSSPSTRCVGNGRPPRRAATLRRRPQSRFVRSGRPFTCPSRLLHPTAATTFSSHAPFLSVPKPLTSSSSAAPPAGRGPPRFPPPPPPGWVQPAASSRRELPGITGLSVTLRLFPMSLVLGARCLPAEGDLWEGKKRGAKRGEEGGAARLPRLAEGAASQGSGRGGGFCSGRAVVSPGDPSASPPFSAFPSSLGSRYSWGSKAGPRAGARSSLRGRAKSERVPDGRTLGCWCLPLATKGAGVMPGTIAQASETRHNP